MSKPKPCQDACDCTPTVEGYYFATHRKYGWRCVVQFTKNGLGNMRLFACRISRGMGLEEFTDYVGPLIDPKPLKAKAGAR